MLVTSLRINNVRSLQEVNLNLGPNFNLFIGDNGVGKTSILEALDFLSRGRSFRTHHVSEIINSDTAALSISITLLDESNFSRTINLKKSSAHTDLSINEQKVSKWSDIAQYLPIISIHPESYLYVTGGPSERRKYIDWGLFHVEPSYRDHWSTYMKALKQRNVCLKNRNLSEAQHWHQVLDKHGSVITRWRQEYCDQISPLIYEFWKNLGLNEQIDMRYSRGWVSDLNLNEALEGELKREEPTLTTRSGPHRAELQITWKNKNFSESSSRGQQKSLTIAMLLAQSEHLKALTNKNSIYLVDELPAELDLPTCKRVIELLKSLDTQILITAVSDHHLVDQIGKDNSWFHVEPGSVNFMV